MNKGLDIIISLSINIFLALTWAVFMILTGDIPVVLEVYDAMGIIIALVAVTSVYSLYLRKSRCNLLNLIQTSGLLFIWGMCLVDELKYSYNQVARIVEIIGFGLILVVFIQIVFNMVKSKKK
ncbi:hypothetical protein [Clostridium sp. CCUG 7971]|uniref:hypothetical protein n=1 Tax=Clostridium sp. CCUG 7971 TaxID=2811414 RepID=UPI001ABB238C|nr:hypothetical protein [Clostridium sp. CCUG 7971]MBO3444907.1 hypothetical protein [Clostridium sp. CCUG 7971]